MVREIHDFEGESCIIQSLLSRQAPVVGSGISNVSKCVLSVFYLCRRLSFLYDGDYIHSEPSSNIVKLTLTRRIWHS